MLKTTNIKFYSRGTYHKTLCLDWVPWHRAQCTWSYDFPRRSISPRFPHTMFRLAGISRCASVCCTSGRVLHSTTQGRSQTPAQLGCLLCDGDTANCDDFSGITLELRSNRRVPVGIVVDTWRSFRYDQLVQPRKRLAVIPRVSRCSDWNQKIIPCSSHNERRGTLRLERRNDTVGKWYVVKKKKSKNRYAKENDSTSNEATFFYAMYAY